MTTKKVSVEIVFVESGFRRLFYEAVDISRLTLHRTLSLRVETLVMAISKLGLNELLTGLPEYQYEIEITEQGSEEPIRMYPHQWVPLFDGCFITIRTRIPFSHD